ncbi:hypothetical protein PM082_021851 [Marasmius tenuissimus]|nr:hypothetical protein PM082_021851 [Marasmius tenuissimus]
MSYLTEKCPQCTIVPLAKRAWSVLSRASACFWHRCQRTNIKRGNYLQRQTHIAGGAYYRHAEVSIRSKSKTPCAQKSLFWHRDHMTYIIRFFLISRFSFRRTGCRLRQWRRSLWDTQDFLHRATVSSDGRAMQGGANCEERMFVISPGGFFFWLLINPRLPQTRTMKHSSSIDRSLTRAFIVSIVI